MPESSGLTSGFVSMQTNAGSESILMKIKIVHDSSSIFGHVVRRDLRKNALTGFDEVRLGALDVDATKRLIEVATGDASLKLATI